VLAIGHEVELGLSFWKTYPAWSWSVSKFLLRSDMVPRSVAGLAYEVNGSRESRQAVERLSVPEVSD